MGIDVNNRGMSTFTTFTTLTSLTVTYILYTNIHVYCIHMTRTRLGRCLLLLLPLLNCSVLSFFFKYKTPGDRSDQSGQLILSANLSVKPLSTCRYYLNLLLYKTCVDCLIQIKNKM